MALDDLNDDEEEKPVEKKSGKPWMMIAIISLVVIILIAGTIGGTMYMTGAFSTDQETVDDQELEDEGEKKKKKKKVKKKKVDNAMVSYFSIEPAFVVNFVNNNQIHYLQVSIDVMTVTPDAVAAVEKHLPVIRNNLIMLFSDVDFSVLTSSTGKEELRKKALAEIRKVLTNLTGEPVVENIYFTAFVMQ